MARGSMTMSLAPLRAAASILSPMMGCYSVVLEPTMRMTSASSRSSIELVMAPLPKAVARPATVGLCHKRAQWSTLLVPTTARASFCSR
jgi:hypothetical protein